MKIINRILEVKILRPILIPIMTFFGFFYIIIDYIFNIEE
jgi:hypothetical protein